MILVFSRLPEGEEDGGGIWEERMRDARLRRRGWSFGRQGGYISIRQQRTKCTHVDPERCHLGGHVRECWNDWVGLSPVLRSKF